MGVISKRRIAVLLPDLRAGGAERVSIDLAHEVQRAGQQVDFVLRCAQGEFLEEVQAAFPVIDLKAKRLRGVPMPLAGYLRQWRPDALLAVMWPLTVMAPFARWLSGHRCRIVIAEHSTLSSQYGALGHVHGGVMRSSMAVGYRMVDARVGVSKGVMHDMASLSAIPDRDFRIVHNPVPRRANPNAAAIAKAEALWGVGRGARVLSVGNFKNAKNHPLLLRSFAHMAAPNARLMLVGRGENERRLMVLAGELGVSEQVIFAGFHKDPTPYYMTADLFALASDREGLPTVLIEALSCGLPVISTDCLSGPAEILENGKLGRLTPVGDMQALAQAMIDALAADHDQAALKQRAMDFSPEIAARKYLDLLLPGEPHG